MSNSHTGVWTRFPASTAPAAPTDIPIMQCRTCGYDLWNLPEPRCPECGSAFDLRTYRFVKDSVAFACPECGGHHPGSGEAFLPSTLHQITCIHCAQTIEVARMSVVPLTAEPVPAIGERVPWEQRDRKAVLVPWFQTVRLVMGSPVQAGRRIDPRNRGVKPLSFAICTHALGLLPNAILLAGLLCITVLLVEPPTWDSAAIAICMAVAIFSVYAVTAGVLITTVLSLAAHLFLKVFEPNHKSLPATIRCAAYAQAPIVLMAIPVCGFHIASTVGYIWMFVALVGLLRGAHGTTLGRAIGAAIWLPVTLIVCYLAVVIAVTATPLGGLFNP